MSRRPQAGGSFLPGEDIDFKGDNLFTGPTNFDEAPTIGVDAADGAVVSEDAAQTLTNKTLTAPTITAPVITGSGTQTGGTLTSPTIVTPAGVVVALEAAFVQVAGNKVHTATFTIPAGATILDIYVTNVTVWDSDTSATLKIGLVDDDCFFTAALLHSAGTLAAGTTANFIWTGGYQGASVPAIDGGGANDVLGAANGFLYKATAQSLTAIVTDVNVSGVAGRTRVTVLYSLPSSVIAPVVV